MKSLMERRRAMMYHVSGSIDTSPRIAEYGVFWSRTYGSKTQNTDWAVTEHYSFKRNGETTVQLVGYVGNDGSNHTFQYYGEKTDGTTYTNWYYFNGNSSQNANVANIKDGTDVNITFSVQLSVIDDVYMYHGGTGQILFAGRNTIYYGHRNISELA